MRRKWVQMKDGKLKEVDPHTYRPINSSLGWDGVIPDIKSFLTIDDVEISGRRQLREYEQRTGQRQVGNDYKPPPPHDEAIRQTQQDLVAFRAKTNQELDSQGFSPIPKEDIKTNWVDINEHGHPHGEG